MIQYISRLILDSGTVTEFTVGDTYIIETYIAGDWNGTIGSHTILSADGTSATLILPQNIYVNYLDLQNIQVSGSYKIYANSATCSDLGGNNYNVIFGKSSGNTLINATIRGDSVVVVKTYIDGMAYVCYINGTNLMMDRKYFDNIDNIIGLNASIA